MNLVLVSCAVALFAFIINRYLKNKKKYEWVKNIPGNTPTFLLGNVGWLLKLYYANTGVDPGIYILQRMMGSADVYREKGLQIFWFAHVPIVGIFSPDAVEKVLSSNVSLEKSFEYEFLHKWLGLGLLTSTGPKWRSRRKVLTPAFHFRILDDFLPTFNEQANILVRKLARNVDKEYVDITPLIILCTLDVVCETMMGCHVGAQQGQNSDYVTAIHNLADFFNKRNASPWLWYDFTFNLSSIGRSFNRDLDILHKFTKKVIKEKKDSLLQRKNEESKVSEDEFRPKERKALMDLLLDLQLKGEDLTEDDIQEQIDTFMFEGHDTTAMAIIFALYCIGLYPDIQRKLYEEMEGIFENNTERPVTMEDVRNMKYLECVLKESNRLFPSVPLIGRKLDEDLHIKDMLLPKGTTIHCHIINLHRDPKTFPQPDIFDPDRFLPENCLNRHPYSYIPFSAGPRNCIGQKFAILEEKVIVCNILRHFRLVSLDPRDKVHAKVEFTLRPAQPIRLKIIPR